MKCNECPEKAEWIMEWQEKYLLLCQGCLDSYVSFEGEINLDFWLMALGDWQIIFNHINSKIKYWQEMYQRAYEGEFRSSKKSKP